MKKIITLFTFLVIFQSMVYAQESFTAELKIKNNSNVKIKIDVYPIGAVFNGDKKYNLKSKYPIDSINKFIYGGSKILFGDDHTFELNHDADYEFGTSHASISYGKYRVRFSVYNSITEDFDSLDYCDVDYSDSDYPYQNHNDLIFFFNNDSSITFTFLSTFYNIIEAGRYLKIWDQFGGSFNKTLNKNGFISDSSYLYIPINAVDSMAPGHINRGDIYLNFNLTNDMYTKNILLDTITKITVKKKAAMIINSGKTFNMITPSFGYNNLIVEDTAFLVLYSNGKINVNYPNRITLKSNSNLTLHNNSEINIIEGGYFCNEGGKIRGPGNLIFKKGLHGVCPGIDNIIKVEDSAKIILEDSAVVIFPDDFNLHLRGNMTSLIMNPGSKLIFGENSGIVCDSGAKVIADNAVFTSADSTKKWNGISLKHRSQDTIKNCVIKNADIGILIMNKNDDEETGIPFSTEISGCSFINQTSHVLNNAIYAAGSGKLLIMNNTISSNILSKGFDHGIYSEHCGGGYFNIIGNTISNSGNGMTIFSSSPFVSKNTVNGNQYSESGIFISDSYGKFEYNIINDFYYTYYSLLSSPELLKNVFNSSYNDNICLSYSSVPNMHPVISGGSTYWISGDNHFTGSPSGAGIFFEDESYPNMAFGYNRFTLTNNDYYINGTSPTNSDTFDVRENYWGTLSPDQYKINVENSDGLLFNPYDDNSSEQRSVNNYTLYDIGFGLYDTVFFQESDDPGIAQELYLEAYQKEHSGEYQEAIEIYKEIISDYPGNTGGSLDKAVSSLSRIFICYEKKNSTVSEYGALQNYYSNIFNDTSYSESQRNLSEDFIIKTKVKLNNIEEAISDYNTIYLNNINTSKGMHALINKEILNAGDGDNFTGGTGIENLEYKQTRINGILSALINKRFNILSKINIQPESFVLSQNYPNPFNPVTKIAFSIPVSGNISIKVYDITGKEIKTLVNEFRNAGTYNSEFNGADLSSGVYYYKMETGNFSEIKKMILIK